MKRVESLVVLLFAFAVANAHAGEIGFIEDFSLAKDRSVPLKQLIPGTEAYYYYHCLHYQNNEQFDKVDEMLAAWIKRHNYTGLVNEIRYRQALLTYDKDPAKSLEFIRKELGLGFNHQRETLGFKPNRPTSLDQKLIGRQRLAANAFARYNNLQGFENSALDWLVDEKLNADDRRHLIQRLARPDYETLPELIVEDLNYKYSKGFGGANIHRQLLKTQLDALLKLKPDLRNQTHFVNTYLTKLHPANDVDWQYDAVAREAYLDRLWKFVTTLIPAHNSLKAHVLYHRLVHDRANGKFDKDRFMTYIALPRHVSYINSDFMKRETSRRYAANLSANYQNFTMLPPVGNDEPLVRSYLHHFFVSEKSYKPYEEWINDLYLKYNFAETKIVNGLGEPEQWYSMLPPERYQQLKQRIDLDFAFTNSPLFSPDDPVSLDVSIKNVKSLIVKVYEINTQNFYRESMREIDTDINLDGLVANDEKTFEYTEPPLRRVKRHFEFPQCEGRGVYVIDFIGNGKSSRAVVRKGKLRFLTRTSTAGQIFTVLDERNKKLDKATMWLAGHEYKTDEDGLITVPFSNGPGRQQIILSSNGFSTLDSFSHESENYSLTAGIYVDRASLLNRQKAKVIVRPALYLNGVPVTISILEEVKLVINSTDLGGISSSKEVSDFELAEDRESIYDFSTPKRLSQISFTLRAKVQNLSQDKKVDLAASNNFALNQIDGTEKTEDLHFLSIDGKYFIDVLGKSGEAKADREVNVSIKHRDFVDRVSIALQTDENGRVHLGALKGITQVTATGPQGTSHAWDLRSDDHSRYQSVHGLAGDAVNIPYMGSSDKPARDEISLLELRGGTFVADRFDACAIKDGLLQVSKLPRGDYDLLLKHDGTRIQLRLSEGEVRDRFVLSENRQLEVRGASPLQVDDVKVGDDAISISLANATEFSRVHVFATRYRPAFSAFANLGRVADAEPYVLSVPKKESLYVAGRNIGDEYRYIIDRRYAKKFPGNMLERPSLLLNPWAIRSTETGHQDAKAGEDFGSVGSDKESGGSRGGKKRPSTGSAQDFANLDFLKQSTAVLVNLTPDEKGVVTIQRDLLDSNQHIHLVACDPTTTVYRSVSLPETKPEMNDLRLAHGLDPSKHFTQQKQITVVRPKNDFVLSDITTSRFQAYDNLASVYTLYATLSNDPKLLEFSFVLGWHKLKDEEKRTLYSKYACHELAFFISQKDTKFFNTAIKPYLANKKDKTFLDRWLLADDTIDEYLKPWNHAQLNTVERILLSQRIDGESRHTSRHINDLFDLIPPDTDRFNHLFHTALKGSALETEDEFDFESAKTEELQELGDQLKALTKNAPRRPASGNNANGKAFGGDGSDASADDADGMPATPPAAPDPFGEPKAKPHQSAGRESNRAKEKANKKAEAEERSSSMSRDRAGYFGRDEARRANARQFYRKLDKTQEWVENNYYKLAIHQQNANLVTVNAFWNDYAKHDPGQPFYSVHLAEASRNFTEMMFALSVLDLPPSSPEHESGFDGAKMTLKSGGPIVAFHEEIKPVSDEAGNTPILVSQNFFRRDDRYRHENNQRYDKYVNDEFLVHTVYGAQVVVTNPTSSPRKLDVLLQIPLGALPVLNSKETRSVHIQLAPYNTQTVEYYFYFPAPGKFPHYPVHVAQNEELMAFAEAFTFNVVSEPSKIDRTSWAYISQHGSTEDVIAYLKTNNLNRTNLDKIAFRMQDKRFFQTVIDLLAERHVYNNTLWSYGIKHDVVAAIREYLQHSGYINRCGSSLDSTLVTVDPVVRKTYEHMEYKPLVNARAHQLGRRRQILNNRFEGQYNRLLKVLSYHRTLSDDDLMAVTYYLLLQDRVEEAIGSFDQVNVDNLATRMQYDYAAAYVALYLQDVGQARDIAARYADHPVDRWRNSFVAITSQLDEIESGDTKVIDDENRTETQTNLAATQPNFDFKVESKKVNLNYQNLASVTVNYYLMDIELLFSRNPFVQQYTGQFSYITPNQTTVMKLDAVQNSVTFELPEALHSSNVLVEIKAAGQTKQQAYYSNSLNVQTIENYGQVRVTHAKTGKPISKTYVKVYAQNQNGQIKFYKDGYTDLRGRFDYTSLNTNELDFVQKFSLLVLSDTDGAVVREANPPKR